MARDAGIEVVTVDDVMEHGIEKVVEVALASLGSDADAIYVDLDLDVLDRAYRAGDAWVAAGWPYALGHSAGGALVRRSPSRACD